MDVRKVILFGLLLLLLSACSNDAPEGKITKTSDSCVPTEDQSKILVTWKDGRITVEKGDTRERFAKNFIEPNLDQIDFAEYDQRIHINKSSELTTSSAGDFGNWGAEAVNVAPAWASNLRGKDAIVAVIDSGVDITHPLLASQIFVNSGEVPGNDIDDDNNGYVDDVSGWDFANNNNNVNDNSEHGTHVSGIIAAHHEDDVPDKNVIQGTAPDAKIIPLKFIKERSEDGDDPRGGTGSVGDAIKAINYAAKIGAHVINASWGGSEDCSQSLRNSVAKLQAESVLFVAAAGNEGVNIDVFSRAPAGFNLPHQITVGSITPYFGRAGHSNYGLSVQLFAPGYEIPSTIPGGIEVLSGTSMATPYVAAAAAILRGYSPSASVAQIRQAILQSVVQSDTYNNATKGRLNIWGAKLALDNLSQ